MWLLYLALGIALFYAGLVSLATLFQTKLLFPVQMAAANRPILPRSAERLELTTPDGDQLIGVRLGSLSNPKPLLLGFAAMPGMRMLRTFICMASFPTMR